MSSEQATPEPDLTMVFDKPLFSGSGVVVRLLRSQKSTRKQKPLQIHGRIWFWHGFFAAKTRGRGGRAFGASTEEGACSPPYCRRVTTSRSMFVCFSQQLNTYPHALADAGSWLEQGRGDKWKFAHQPRHQQHVLIPSPRAFGARRGDKYMLLMSRLLCKCSTYPLDLAQASCRHPRRRGDKY